MKEIVRGKSYYYGKSEEKYICIKVGELLSSFIGKDGSEYQFYNEDMFDKKVEHISLK